MYLISFLGAYVYLIYVSKSLWLRHYSNLQNLLNSGLDDLMVYLILGVLIGGRLGDVFLYNWSYYSHHLIEIMQVRNGGMSFVGGFIGVAIAVFLLKKFKQLEYKELFVLFDLIIIYLPVGILLGRIGNGLNQELYGKVVQLMNFDGGIIDYEFLHTFHIIRIYSAIDNQLRRNTNLLEGFFEGFVLLICNVLLFGKKIVTGIYRPGFITGFFCIVYGIIRFFLEILRDNPSSEYIGGILKSQILMFGILVLGALLVFGSRYFLSKLDNNE